MPDAPRKPVHDAETAIHVALVAMLLWWGFVMSVGSDLVHVNRGFVQLARIGTDAQWSRWLLATAAVGTLGMVPRLHRLRMASVVALSLMHSFLALLLCLGNHLSTGAGVYTTVAVLAFYLVICEAMR